MSDTHPTTVRDLPPLEMLEWLVSEAQQATHAVQAFAGKTNSGLPFDLEFDVLTHIAGAIRSLDACQAEVGRWIEQARKSEPTNEAR